LCSKIDISEIRDYCSVCEYVVETVVKFVNYTKAEIEKQMLAACKSLPGQLEQLCETFVLVYGKDVITWIVDNGLKPRDVCSYLGFCSSPSLKVDTQCDICVFVVTQAARFINGTEEQIEKALLAQCKKLPGQLEKICETLVLTYGKDIIKWLLAKVQPKEICTRIGLCKKNSTVVVAQKTDVCGVCEYAVDFVVKYINGSKEEIQKNLLEQCKRLPGEVAQICQTFVIVYGQQVIEFIVDQGKNPREACKKIRILL
jgi:hypothetical protein